MLWGFGLVRVRKRIQFVDVGGGTRHGQIQAMCEEGGFGTRRVIMFENSMHVILVPGKMYIAYSCRP